MITADVAATQALTFAIPIGVAVRRDALGILPAPTDQVSDRGCRRAAPCRDRPWRSVVSRGAVLGVLWPWSRRSRARPAGTSTRVALQFSLLAIVVPALVALGAPWRLFGLAAGTATAIRQDRRPCRRPPAPAS